MSGGVVDEIARSRLGKNLRGKWTLDRLIGVGGMAAVYAATHRNGARVAVKMLHTMLSASSSIRERFLREGYLANKVDHPGVVRVLDDDVDEEGSAFLVMDLIVGRTLADRANDELLDEAELLDVAEQVLEVLVAAHGKGIVHRDLKPDNLLLDAQGKLHVLDFGIARLLDDPNASTATKTGHGAGTPGFMAPEQALGRAKEISARTDIYALGATLFALASGQFVHDAETPEEQAVKVATQPARSLSVVAPTLPREIIALVDGATKRSADDRFPDATTMLSEVRRVRGELVLEKGVLRPERPDRTQRPRRIYMAQERHASPSAPTEPPPAPLGIQSRTPQRTPPRPPPRRQPWGSSGENPAMSVGPTPSGSMDPVVLAHPPKRRTSLVMAGVAGGIVLVAALVFVVMRSSGAPEVPKHRASATEEPAERSPASPPVKAAEPAPRIDPPPSSPGTDPASASAPLSATPTAFAPGKLLPLRPKASASASGAPAPSAAKPSVPPASESKPVNSLGY